MAKKSHGPEHIIAAAFDLAAERGWRSVSLADIAARTATPMAELVDHYPNKTAILDAYARMIDRRMLEGGVEAGDSPRDRLFEVVMRRFEAMAPHRRGLASILCQSGDDPWALVCGARRYYKSMALTLETAGISSFGLIGMARIEGLAFLTLYVLRTFLDDDNDDLSRTMAALDKALGRAEGVAGLVWRRSAPTRGTDEAAAV